ncbi:hypothetical protein H8356DRAFT_1739232 [Neocallimastix lanati (nom. inval.)]|jgi:hypothetical protein|uniref:Mid2 domain-containing protein n=1 Tax=Neocallimastix californiae TaxID=1754190 RepID=A0A1Y2E725_9FUNG|nr:hypothetical protein H8356DRAFT_1739232 [Neocallimastix sp. JGI-2020a]ORY66675.1 hypothetical protein LY90DRAFT_700590 [Neocallimastix californiae]|eukprot:ORY66675.1 hypothetical protein LY90DRAFT_700590 [Neocallimastix californiae]
MNLLYNNSLNISVVKNNEKRKILYGRSPTSGLSKYNHSNKEDSNNSNGKVIIVPKKKPPVSDQNRNSKEILKSVFGIATGVIALIIITYIIYLIVSIILKKRKERKNNKVNTENNSIESNNDPIPNPIPDQNSNINPYLNPNSNLINEKEISNPSTQNSPYTSVSIQPNTDANTNMDSLSQTYQPNRFYPPSIYSITYCQTCYVPQVINYPIAQARNFPRQTYSAPYRPKSHQSYSLVPHKVSIPSINNYVKNTSYTNASNI